ncbi:unnamed protein product, partial [marine sediment metagenome]
YDRESLEERVFSVLGSGRLLSSEVWGERRRGWFEDYIERLKKGGLFVSCKDSYYMSRWFSRVASVSALPGSGLVCLCFEKSDTGRPEC